MTMREIRQLMSQLTALEPALVVLEATGGLETVPLWRPWRPRSRRWSSSIPGRCETSPKATGKLAKTDALDAAVLAPLRRGGPDPRYAP